MVNVARTTRHEDAEYQCSQYRITLPHYAIDMPLSFSFIFVRFDIIIAIICHCYVGHIVQKIFL